MFFGNFSDHGSPVANQTAIAGSDSLEGGAEMFRFFAGLEAREAGNDGRAEWVEDGPRQRSIDVLESAAKSYAAIASEVDSELLIIADDQFEEASVTRDYQYYFNEPITLGRSRRGIYNRRALYNELARRANRLASSLRALNINADDRDLAGPVFQCMEQWESFASLARIVAVLNRHNENRARERRE
jgi:hypothetical protein